MPMSRRVFWCWAEQERQYVTPYKHAHIYHFDQARVFRDSVQKKGCPRGRLIRSPHQPSTFPLNKKKSRACSFEGCFLSSLLHPLLIFSSAFVAGLLPPAERAGCKPGEPAPAALLPGPQAHPAAAGPSSRCPSPGPSPRGHLEPLPAERAWEIESTPIRA